MADDAPQQNPPVGGIMGSGKGSALWSRRPWTIDFTAGAETAELVPPEAPTPDSAQAGRTMRRRLRLGSGLRPPSRRRSRTAPGGDSGEGA